MLVVGILLLLVGAFAGTTALSVLLRALKRGAFDDAEDIKFVVFRDDEDDYDYDEPPL